MEPIKRFLFWLLDGTRGGPMRLRILSSLASRPMNLHQLALGIGVDYSTAEHHIRLMEKHSIVECTGTGYGKMYFVSDSPLVRQYINERIKGEGNENQNQTKKRPKA